MTPIFENQNTNQKVIKLHCFVRTKKEAPGPTYDFVFFTFWTLYATKVVLAIKTTFWFIFFKTRLQPFLETTILPILESYSAKTGNSNENAVANPIYLVTDSVEYE